MERLTYFENGEWRLDFNGCQYQANFVDRLAAYEDSGLSPGEVASLWAEWDAMMSVLNSIGGYDRLKELAWADKEGRVVVLPCKVGDTAYRLQYIEETPGRYVVGVTEMKFSLEWVADVGKTIFATREEAEAALKEVRNGNR